MTNENDSSQLTREQWEMQEISTVVAELIKGIEEINEVNADCNEGKNILSQYQSAYSITIEASAADYTKRMEKKYPILKWRRILKELNISNITHFNLTPLTAPTTLELLIATLNNIYPAAACKFLGEEVVKGAIKEHFYMLQANLHKKIS